MLPGAPRFDFASLKLYRRMRELMALRTRLFLHLARVRSIRRPGPACIVTSGEIIRGRFGNALSVGVIPMRLVTRSRVTPACVYVWHERGKVGWQAARRQWAEHGEPVA